MRFKTLFARMPGKPTGSSGRMQFLWAGLILSFALALGTVVVVFTNFGAPDSITIASGPPGSSFERYAERYRKILAKEGVTVHIVKSEGSKDNLGKLSDPKSAIDVGFVLGGEASKAEGGRAGAGNLVSLGSVNYQPLMIFYRGERRDLISDFSGKRLDIGEEGSGAHSLALMLLKENGIENDGKTVFVNTAGGDEARALLEDRVDAIFVMGESTSGDMMRRLLRTPGIQLFHVAQADGYVRRFAQLNKLTLPRGALDFGKDIPAADTTLVGPTVEIIARDSLHPALSDLLLEAAREVHGGASLFRKRGEFPAPQEHEFRISPDASRYYKTGKSFLYRSFPYGVASIIARVIAFIVPVALVLIPALKMAPGIYRWRMESRIHRWYRALLELERDALSSSANAKTRDDLLKRLDRIEDSVSRITVPAAFGDLFYGLRGHICFVRNLLLSQRAPGSHGPG
jgi:hypothetical protein